MRKLLIGLLVVLLLVIVVVAGLLFVPSPAQKWAVERAATMALGREVTISGPFRLRAWPPVAIDAADVRFANADWGRSPELAQIEQIELVVPLMDYLREDLLQVDRLLLRRPRVSLEINEDGAANWRLGAPESPDRPAGGSGTGGEAPRVVLQDIRIEDGTVAFDDRASGNQRQAEDIDLTIAQAAADQPLAIDGGLAMNGQRATLKGSVASPGTLASGQPSPIALEAALPGTSARFEGTVASIGPAAKGRATIEAAPRALLAWLGIEPGLPEAALQKARIAADVAADAGQVTLEPLEIGVDDITGTGRLTAALGDRPRVEGALAFGMLDLNRYLPEAQPAAAQPAEAATARGGDAGWSTDPILLPLPLPVDATLDLRADGVQVERLRLGPLALRVLADRQRAAVEIDKLGAYGGALSGSAEARPGDRPAYALKLQARGIQLTQVHELTGVERVDGEALADLDVTATGTSQKELVETADGGGRVIVTDGAILGINVAGIVRRIMTLGMSAGTDAQRTDFAEAGGSFTIAKGMVRNDDLHLQAPLLRLDGQGTVDLPKRSLDFRVRPQLAATLEGQDASSRPALQAGIPFVVQGPLTAPAIRFDLNGALTGAISGPEDVARIAADLAKDPQALLSLKSEFKLLEELNPGGAARQLLDGVLGTPKPGAKKGKATPEDAVRGLLKGFGR